MFTYVFIIFIINIVYTYFVFVQPKYTVKLCETVCDLKLRKFIIFSGKCHQVDCHYK